MKKVTAILSLAWGMCASYLAIANPEAIELKQSVEMACPIAWEDLSSDINLIQPSQNLWQNDSSGKAGFIGYLEIVLADPTLTQAELTALAEDNAIVARECASQRIALKKYQLKETSGDLLISLNAEEAGLSGFEAALDDPILNGGIGWMIPIYHLILN